MRTKDNDKKKEMPATPQADPPVVVEQHQAEISQAGAKYQYPLDIAAKGAQRNPRNERKVLDGALDELSLAPELAAGSYYSIPRRKFNRETDQYEIVKIEGPSIGAAMSLARRWGNCINGSHIREELDDRIVCEGVFIDAETNTWTFRTIAAEKFFVDKTTKISKPLAPDMLVNAIQAAQSKAVRNAILATLPKWLTRAYFDEAKRMASGGKARDGDARPAMSAKDRMVWLEKHFPSLGVSVEMLTTHIGNALKDCTLEEQVGELVGIYNAIRDGQAKVEEIFGKMGKKEETVSGPVKSGELWPG